MIDSIIPPRFCWSWRSALRPSSVSWSDKPSGARGRLSRCRGANAPSSPIVVIELLLTGGWIWLHVMAMISPHAAKDSARAIGELFGGAMGPVLAVSPLLYLMARNNHRTAACETPWLSSNHPSRDRSLTCGGKLITASGVLLLIFAALSL
jgi:hypothetical protein